jgi:ribosome-associated protein
MLAADEHRSRAEPDLEPSRLTGSAAPSSSSSVQRALVAAEVAADKLAHDIVVLDVGEIISIIDCFVIASASNPRQARTVVDEVENALRDLDGSKPVCVEGLEDASWVLLDYGDIVVHVFVEETRAYYDLDRLWADAVRIPFEAPPRVAMGEAREASR